MSGSRRAGRRSCTPLCATRYSRATWGACGVLTRAPTLGPPTGELQPYPSGCTVLELTVLWTAHCSGHADGVCNNRRQDPRLLAARPRHRQAHSRLNRFHPQLIPTFADSHLRPLRTPHVWLIPAKAKFVLSCFYARFGFRPIPTAAHSHYG